MDSNALLLQKALSVIHNLSEDTGFVCYVDTATNEVTRFYTSPALEAVWALVDPSLSSNLQYDSFLNRLILPEDRQDFLRAVNRELAMDELERRNFFSAEFRGRLNGVIHQYRMDVATDRDESGGIRGVVEVIRNVDKEETRDAILRVLADDFTGLYLVDLNRARSEAISVSDRIRKDTGRSIAEHADLKDVLFQFVSTVVHPEDRYLFADLRDFSAVIKRLAHKKRDTIVFRRNFDGKYKYTRMTLAKAEGRDERPGVVALGFEEIDEEYREQLRRQAILTGLTNDFDCVSYIDLDDDCAVKSYRVTPFFLQRIPDWLEIRDFDALRRVYCERVVVPEDRERFLQETEREFVVDHLHRESAHFSTFRIRDSEGERYYQIKFTGSYADNVLHGIAVGCRNADEQTRAEIQLRERLYQANEQAEKTIMRRTAELRDRNRELSRTNEEIIELLGDVVEMRDRDSGEHIFRVKIFTRALTQQVMADCPEYGLTAEDVRIISYASALHDVGKIFIPDSILLKPGRLTTEEFEIMKTHCDRGCSLLERIPKSWDPRYVDISRDICRFHHERWNGKGYPCGLKGDEIPIAAQIVAVADCFDALTTRRVYKDAYPPDVAFEMILDGDCGEFSPKLLSALKKCREFFESHADSKNAGRREDFEEPAVPTNSLAGTGILLVDDSALSREITRGILEFEGATVTEAPDGPRALDLFRGGGFDAVLMDVLMPGMDGIETTRLLREQEADRDNPVPVVALTAEPTSANSSAMINAGANACLSKPLAVAELTRVLLSCMRERSARLERKLADTTRSANTDPLTHVKNITAYTDQVAELADAIRSTVPPSFAILMCDVNGIKTVNDRFGHDTGDRYIQNSCSLICRVCKHSPVFRIGGDEFVAVLQGVDYKYRSDRVRELQDAVYRAELLPDFEAGKASLSFGLSAYDPVQDFSISEVIQRAADAMAVHKQSTEGTHNL